VRSPPVGLGHRHRANATRLGSTFVLYWVADDRLTIWTVTPDGAVNSRQVNVLRSSSRRS
jgi:hypothetical protein